MNRLSILAFLILAFVLFYWSTVATEKDSECTNFLLQELKSAAEAGVNEAQNKLAYHYEYGVCVSRDFKEAAKWYHRAADQDNTNAQKVLGFMYAGGMGVTQDTAQAVNWFRLAAEKGHPEAQLGLAIAYFKGNGIERDLKTAVQWFEKSAEQNFARSQFNLGNLYKTGQGVPQNKIKAYQWFGLAARNGYPKADKALEALESNMNPESIAAAKQLIADWQPLKNSPSWSNNSDLD